MKTTGDRYDEAPRKQNDMEEIDDWDSGRKTIASEAVDKVKGLWNKVQGKKGQDDIVDYRWVHCRDTWDMFWVITSQFEVYHLQILHSLLSTLYC